MRSLRITMYTEQPITLPLAYNELLQGVLYGCWRERFPRLHDEGLGGLRAFRPFTFSRLTGESHASTSSRTIRFYHLVSFEVRSIVEELLDELAVQLSSRGSVRLGAYKLALCNLQSCDRLLFPQRAMIELLTPIVACETLDDGHTRYCAPSDTDWLGMIQANTRGKIEALELGCSPDVQAIPLTETLRKQVTRFKGTYVTGWTGRMILAADAQTMAMLWCLGLGVKNSQGFGMFDFDERPL